MIWPFYNRTTNKPVLCDLSNDFFVYRDYARTKFNPDGDHFGVDGDVVTGTLGRLPVQLKITFAGNFGDLGLLLAGVDVDGREWGFAHNSHISSAIRVGSTYPAGTAAFLTGQTGRASGPHSHMFRTIRRALPHWGSQPYEWLLPELLEARKRAGR